MFSSQKKSITFWQFLTPQKLHIWVDAWLARFPIHIWGSTIIKQRFTLGAFVWPLSTVCNHMTLNNICSRGGIITLVAFVRFHWMMFVLRSWAKIYSQSLSSCDSLSDFSCTYVFLGSPIHLTQELLIWIKIWHWDLNVKKAWHSLYHLSHLESQDNKSFEDMRILIFQDLRILKSCA